MTEAKDTVLTSDKRTEILKDTFGFVSVDLINESKKGWVYSLLAQQDIISKKAGKEQARKETIPILNLAHNALDAINGKLGNEQELCLFCHSNLADGSGIIHRENCVILLVRKALKSGKGVK